VPSNIAAIAPPSEERSTGGGQQKSGRRRLVFLRTANRRRLARCVMVGESGVRDGQALNLQQCVCDGRTRKALVESPRRKAIGLHSARRSHTIRHLWTLIPL